MSKIYGFFGGSHDASTSLIVDGEIRFCIEEERMTRIKAGNDYFAVPQASLREVEIRSGITIDDSDHIVFADHTPRDFASSLMLPYSTYNHHLCHAAGAYYTSGIQEKCLVIAMDGGGTMETIQIYKAEGGKMEMVHRSHYPSSGTLALLWAYSTQSCRGVDQDGNFIWKMSKDEGKLMGMAPDGEYDEKMYRLIRQIVDYKDFNFYPVDTIGRTRFTVENMRFRGWIDPPYGLANFAHNLQKVTEDIMREFMADIHSRFPEYRHLCLSGGIFANVKVNQVINELPWVEEIYVYPPMGDNGLSLGAAILKCRELGEGFMVPQRFKNVHLGTSYREDEIERRLSDEGYVFNKSTYDPTEIAQDLNEGKIIGWFSGGFEYGARALGARSILCRPTDPDTHSKLNERLSRYDTMPFAPVVLDEHFDEIFKSNKSRYSSEFMTICYDTREEWQGRIPAVIQKSDKTARPQRAVKESVPKYWNLINEYYKISGIPVLLNTSFNAHNEPIIDSPERAMKHLVEGIVDKLIIENHVYTRG